MRFAVHEHKLVYDKDKLIRRQLIVLKDSNGYIRKWTNLHKYAHSGKKKVAVNLRSYSDKRCNYVVKLLNYVVFDNFSINRLTDITVDMVRDFLNDYGLCRLADDGEKTHRSKRAVENCISCIIDFLDLMVRDNPKCKLRLDELFRNEIVFNKAKKKYITKRVPAFAINYLDYNKPIFRDITDEAFMIIMNEIVINYPEILMIAACSAFAGLRPAESCNVRRPDSPLGPGIRFDYQDGKVVNIIIDISEKLNLRSDLTDVGGIKRHRFQKVFPLFLDAFMDCYNTYMDYMKDKPYEANYGALNVTSSGKARTYSSYCDIFKKAVKSSIPKMLASDNAQTVHYGQLLLEHNVGPHILRHWFSMKLTLYGLDTAGLMYWRGDKSPESALTYIQNKSELEKQLRMVSEETFNYSLWKAGKLYGDAHD